MATTAVAHGADFLLTGYKLPADARHWESLGEGLRLIQKAGSYLRTTKKTPAKAAMLFPRTHYLQLQEEYFNVGLSFELFLRLRRIGPDPRRASHGRIAERLCGGVLFNVKLLPEDVARHIARFVENGGLLIADCVPSLGRLKQPLDAMELLFGVTHAATGRIRREGHYVPYTVGHQPGWPFRNENSPDESLFETASLRGRALNVALDLTLASPPLHRDHGRSARQNRVRDSRTACQAGRPWTGLSSRLLPAGHLLSRVSTGSPGGPRRAAPRILKNMCDAAGVRARVYSSKSGH